MRKQLLSWGCCKFRPGRETGLPSVPRVECLLLGFREECVRGGPRLGEDVDGPKGLE